MRNHEQWRPTKFVEYKGRLRASRDGQEVGIASRLAADIVAATLAEAIRAACRGCVLDLGSGKSPLFRVYRPHVDWVICADWPHSLHLSPHLDMACDLNCDLPFADTAFDSVVLTDMLEHVPNRAICSMRSAVFSRQAER